MDRRPARHRIRPARLLRRHTTRTTRPDPTPDAMREAPPSSRPTPAVITLGLSPPSTIAVAGPHDPQPGAVARAAPSARVRAVRWAWRRNVRTVRIALAPSLRRSPPIETRHPRSSVPIQVSRGTVRYPRASRLIPRLSQHRDCPVSAARTLPRWPRGRGWPRVTKPAVRPHIETPRVRSQRPLRGCPGLRVGRDATLPRPSRYSTRRMSRSSAAPRRRTKSPPPPPKRPPRYAHVCDTISEAMAAVSAGQGHGSDRLGCRSIRRAR